MNKEAISVYSPKNTLEKCVLESYREVSREWLSEDKLKGFIESSLSYDGLYEEFLKNPSSTSKDMFSSKTTGHIFVPCYTVELRHILRSKSLISSYKISGYSLETAKRYLSEYPIFLV